MRRPQLVPSWFRAVFCFDAAAAAAVVAGGVDEDSRSCCCGKRNAYSPVGAVAERRKTESSETRPRVIAICASYSLLCYHCCNRFLRLCICLWQKVRRAPVLRRRPPPWGGGDAAGPGVAKSCQAFKNSKNAGSAPVLSPPRSSRSSTWSPGGTLLASESCYNKLLVCALQRICRCSTVEDQLVGGPWAWSSSMSASSRSPTRGGGSRDASSPPRRGGVIDLVKELAIVRDHDPSRFPSAYLELKVLQTAAL